MIQGDSTLMQVGQQKQMGEEIQPLVVSSSSAWLWTTLLLLGLLLSWPWDDW